jgi:hypothetical protein
MAWRTVLTLMLAPAAVFATSSGGPTKRTGAAVDGVLVSVNDYTPGYT